MAVRDNFIWWNCYSLSYGICRSPVDSDLVPRAQSQKEALFHICGGILCQRGMLIRHHIDTGRLCMCVRRNAETTEHTNRIHWVPVSQAQEPGIWQQKCKIPKEKFRSTEFNPGWKLHTSLSLALNTFYRSLVSYKKSCSQHKQTSTAPSCPHHLHNALPVPVPGQGPLVAWWGDTVPGFPHCFVACHPDTLPRHHPGLSRWCRCGATCHHWWQMEASLPVWTKGKLLQGCNGERV